jgi:putative sigma-54 modulation protein
VQISVTGRHVEITDAIRDCVHTKLQHDFAEFPRIESVHVILDVEKYRHWAEVVIQAPNHVRLEAKHESDDMYVSIDGAVEKVAKQLRRLTDKVHHSHKTRERLAEVDIEASAASEGKEPEAGG